MLIAQLSAVHAGGGRYRKELLRTAIEQVNAGEPDLVVVAGDLNELISPLLARLFGPIPSGTRRGGVRRPAEG